MWSAFLPSLFSAWHKSRKEEEEEEAGTEPPPSPNLADCHGHEWGGGALPTCFELGQYWVAPSDAKPDPTQGTSTCLPLKTHCRDSCWTRLTLGFDPPLPPWLSLSSQPRSLG